MMVDRAPYLMLGLFLLFTLASVDAQTGPYGPIDEETGAHKVKLVTDAPIQMETTGQLEITNDYLDMVIDYWPELVIAKLPPVEFKDPIPVNVTINDDDGEPTPEYISVRLGLCGIYTVPEGYSFNLLGVVPAPELYRIWVEDMPIDIVRGPYAYEYTSFGPGIMMTGGERLGLIFAPDAPQGCASQNYRGIIQGELTPAT